MRKLVEFDPMAGAPTRWLMFLEELWPDDTESRSLLQEWFGLCLVRDTSFQKALLLVGPQCSGKGIIAEVLGALLGGGPQVGWRALMDIIMPFGMECLLEQTLSIATAPKPRRDIPSELAMKNAASLQGDLEFAFADVLRIVTEARIEVDRKSLGVVKCKLPTRFLLLAREFPKFSSPDATREFRLGILALELRESLTLKNGCDEFTTELPGILLWAIKGWGRLRGRGRFEQPVSGLKLLQGLPLPSRAEASRAFHDGQEHRPPAGVEPDEEPDPDVP